MRQRLFAAAGLCVIMATGCATAVHHETTACSVLSTPHTFAWVTPDPVLIQLGERHTGVRTDANERRIRAAVERELEDRGYTRTAHDEAELHVAFSVGTQRRYRLEGGRDSWVASLSPGEKQTKGTLHIYLLEPDEGNEIWHGWTSQWLTKQDDPDAVIADAVSRITAELPTANADTSCR
ncbi:MAG: DUF4136 domain-containing protein [Deltaproteobacteria bacterium]|nr:DUF4136 domain-containing protein [Nannocystaceae bacterium]